MQTAEFWISHLGLAPHPEGGWYRELYRSDRSFDFGSGTSFGGPRSYATSIHYLLTGRERSRLHRIRSDELWFFHDGKPLDIVCFPETGTPSGFTLGPDADKNQLLQAWVPAGTWFGAHLSNSADHEAFALVSCVVVPGFDFRDFDFADANELLRRYPDQEALIRILTD